MIIEIDDDFADIIVQQALIKDYIHLTNELKEEKKNPGFLHPDDKEAYDHVLKGLEILGYWYFIAGEFHNEVKKARKKK